MVFRNRTECRQRAAERRNMDTDAQQKAKKALIDRYGPEEAEKIREEFNRRLGFLGRPGTGLYPIIDPTELTAEDLKPPTTDERRNDA